MADGAERLRILHVAQPTSGGVAQVVADLARSQRTDGHDVAVVCPGDDGLASRLAAEGIRTVHWDVKRAPGPTLLAETRALDRILAHEAPDLVHLHSSKAALAGRLALRGRLATVFQPHAWSFEAADGVLRFASLRWERLAARWADRVVCVSEAERRLGADVGIAARWAVVANGVDMKRFHPKSDAISDPASDGPLVVAVGRLCRQKGQDVLLHAWPAVLERFGAARLALVGDGPDSARLAGMVADDARLRGVRFLGAVDDPSPWYQAADLVVLPSRWEAMALVPLEASACGRLVVASDVAGVRESLPPERAPWAVVPPGEPRALASALVDALTAAAGDPEGWARAGLRAAEHARTRHDIAQTAAEMTHVYVQVLWERAHAGRAPQQKPPEERSPLLE